MFLNNRINFRSNNNSCNFMPLQNFFAGLLWNRFIYEKPIFSKLATLFVKSDGLLPRLQASSISPYLRLMVTIVLHMLCLFSVINSYVE